MTTVLGQLMTWSTLGTGTGRIWLYDRLQAAARPSDQRSRLHSHLAGPCGRRRTQQSDGRRHSMPGLGVGDQPRDGSDNPRMADSVYRSNYAVWHAVHYEHPLVRLGRTLGESRQPTRASAPGYICPARTWLDDRWNFSPARAGVRPCNGACSHK